MLPPDQYHNPDYDEDLELSDDLRYRRDTEYAKVSPRIRVLTFIAPVAIFSTVLIGFHIMIAAGLAFFALSILLIIRINRDGDRIVANCPSCGVIMLKEVNANVEYHICHGCNIYARGRDWG